MPSASPEAGLAAGLAARLGGGEVHDLRRLSGGANMETWAFDWVPAAEKNEAQAGGQGAGAARPMILRRLPAGVTGGGEDALLPLDLGVEAALLRLAARGGVPVPAVRAELAEADGLGTGYLMDRLPGEALPQKLFRDERYAPALDGLAAACGRALAAIHALPTDDLPPALPRDSHGERLARLQGLLDGFGAVSPVLQLALGWLQANAPAPAAPRLVHGDFRCGNLLVTADGLEAVLDWERAHLGYPAEDLGYLCANVWRFGRSDRPVGGFGAYEDLLDAYRAAAGWAPTVAELHYWEVFAALDWGLVCLTMLDLHRSGRDPSLERAAVGRRLSEAEIDLLLLLEDHL
jgi:aminoglycoside phosphotransferase (APT) family kinase protein